MEYWPSNTAPDQVIEMPQAFQVPAKGAVEYQYFIGSYGIQGRSLGAVGGSAAERPFGGASRRGLHPRARGYLDTRADQGRHSGGVRAGERARSLSGRAWPSWSRRGPIWCSRFITRRTARKWRSASKVGMVFAKSPPAKRVLTLQMDNERFLIPAGEQRLSRQRVGHAAERRAAAGILPAHAPAGEANSSIPGSWPNGLPETLLTREASTISTGSSTTVWRADAAEERDAAQLDRDLRQFGRTIRRIRTLRSTCATGTRAGTR